MLIKGVIFSQCRIMISFGFSFLNVSEDVRPLSSIWCVGLVTNSSHLDDWGDLAGPFISCTAPTRVMF